MLVGTLVGAALTFLPATIPVSEGAAMEGPRAFAQYAVLSFVVCAICWLAGIVVFGVPIWLILKRLGRDTIVAATATGALTPTVVSLALAILDELRIARETGIAFRLYVPFGPEMFIGCGVAAAIGAVVALSIWKAAYRRERDPAEVFA